MPAEKTAIETAIADLKEAVKGDDVEDIKAKTNTLAQASMKLGEAMYKAQQAGRRAPARPPTARRQSPTTMSSTPTSRKSTTTRKARPKEYKPLREKLHGGLLFIQGTELELLGP